MKSKNLIILVNFLTSKWQLVIALLSLVAIGTYLILNILNTTFINLPLLFLIIIGGLPLFLQIILKLLRGNLGVSKAPGSLVLSGAINGEAVLIIQATKLTVDSRYAVIVKVLAEAEQKRPSIRRLGDQIGAIFAPVALLFAVVTWYFTNDAIRFLAVLVIATPCPLLIAIPIPITIISAISRAAKQAIIIKDPIVLEQLPNCKTAIFDKIGTLTYGKLTLIKIYTASNYTKELLAIAHVLRLAMGSKIKIDLPNN